MIEMASTENSGKKIRRVDEIRTHDPPRSSRMP